MMKSVLASFILVSCGVMSVSFWSNTSGPAATGMLASLRRRAAVSRPLWPDPLELLLLDVVDHEGRLDAVVQRDSVDVVLGRLRVPLDDRLGGGDGVHQRHLHLLGDVDDGERHPGVDRAHDAEDPVAGDQPGDVLHALGGLGLVVVDYELHLLPLVPALGVVLLDREGEPHEGALAVVVGAGGQRERGAELQVGCRGRPAEPDHQSDNQDTDPCGGTAPCTHRVSPSGEVGSRRDVVAGSYPVGLRLSRDLARPAYSTWAPRGGCVRRTHRAARMPRSNDAASN